MGKAFVTGVGMTKFEKPGTVDWDYPDMIERAARAALADAGIDYTSVEQVVASYVLGDSCYGQRGIYRLGETGVPVYNQNNQCGSGSTGLVLARQLVEGGIADVVLVVGFEKMQPGSPGAIYRDRTMALDRHVAAMAKRFPGEPIPTAMHMFALAAREHMERYGSTEEHFAMVGVKNHRHASRNPNALFPDEYTLDEVRSSQVMADPLRKLECSANADGGAAAIVMSAAAVERFGLARQAVEIVAQAMVSDYPSSFDGSSVILSLGGDMTAAAAEKVYRTAGIGPDDIDVIELHDCFSVNEVLTYEALGLAQRGEGHLLVEKDETTYGGRWVVNPSGGLIGKGHPMGATGVAQCAELSWQLRGLAGERQVDGARVALQHNGGLGSAFVVTLYRAPMA